MGRTAIDVNINLGPGFNQRAIYVRGLFAAAMVDFDANTCTVDRHTPSSIDFDRYKRSRSVARQLKEQARETFAKYALSRLGLSKGGNPYQNSMLKSITAFYSGIMTGQALDNRLTSDLGRQVIACCTKIIQAANVDQVIGPRSSKRSKTIARPTILILGGSGFIGRELIHQLLAAGYCVRAIVRSSAALLEDLGSDRLEIVRGDLRSSADLEAGLKGIEFVYHLAHAEAKSWTAYVRNEVEPTHAIGKACLTAGVKRLIYTGTIASYYAGARAGTISEQTQLDPRMGRRNYYAHAKAKSESILMEMHYNQGLPVVIFRPGIVIGKGGNPFHWGVGQVFREHLRGLGGWQE